MARTLTWSLVVVAVHLAAHVAHAVVHELVPVRIADWQMAFVTVAMFALPILGVVALYGGRDRLGGSLLAIAGLASLAFEVAFHFVIESPDHVSSVTDLSLLFSTTAVLTAVSDVLLLVVGAWVLVLSRRRSVGDGVSATSPSGRR